MNASTFEYEQAITEPPKYLRSTYLPERAADGSVAGLYILVVDITEQKRAERELQHSALHDFLTGLPNRALLMSHLDQTLALSARRLESCAVMYLDIDRFKAINDSYGHAVGDQVLVQFTRRLRSVMRDADLLARLGGDEFVIVATELPSGSIGALHFAQRIVDSFAQPLEVDGVQYEVHTSVGVAVSCGSSENKEDLLRRADSALYKAKAGGRNTIYMAAPND